MSRTEVMLALAGGIVIDEESTIILEQILIYVHFLSTLFSNQSTSKISSSEGNLTFYRQRRNLLTFAETTKIYWALIFYIHFESGVFFLIYLYQDMMGTDNVFYIVHTLYTAFDFFLLVRVHHFIISSLNKIRFLLAKCSQSLLQGRGSYPHPL